MQILKDYAAQNGFSYEELFNDFDSSKPEEQEEFLMQIGGVPQEQGEDNQLQQIIIAFAQMSGMSPEELMQKLQQMPPEQQQQAIQQMAQALQGDESEVNHNPAEEQLEMQYGGIPVTSRGYYELDPIKDPYAMIPSGDITMEGINYPINAYDGNTGKYLEQMQPGQNYKFDTDKIIEQPIYAQTGPPSTLKVLKIEGNFVTLSNGKKITKNQYKVNYLDRLPFLNQKRYDTDERRIAASIVSSYKELEPKKQAINPLTGNIDPATGYWDRALNYTEELKDPRGVLAEEQIMPFSGVSAGGPLKYTGKVLGHLQKKGNQILTGYYEYPSTTVGRYHDDLGDGTSFTLDLVTDPAFLMDFGPMAVEKAGQQIAKYAPAVYQVAKETAELVGKYGQKAAMYIAKHGEKAAKYIAEHGLVGIEKALGAIEKYGPTVNKFSSIKTQLAKAVNNDDEDPYKTYLASVANKEDSEESFETVLKNNTEKLNTVIKASSTNNPSDLVKAIKTVNPSVKASGLDYSGMFKGSNSQEQETVEPASSFSKNVLAPSEFSMRQDFGKVYGKNKPNIKSKAAPNKFIKTTKYKDAPVNKLPVKSDNKQIVDPISEINFLPDSSLSQEIIEAPNQSVKDLNERNFTLEDLGGEKYWDDSSVNIESEEIVNKKTMPQYKFAANNFIQNLLSGNKIAAAFQPIATAFRQQSHILPEELPEIDVNPMMQKLVGQFKMAQKNINMNSSVGMSAAANFYGDTLDKMVELSNNANQQNQQIKAKNLFSRVKAANQQYQQQQQFDSTAYNDFLQTSANADMIRQQAISEAGQTFLQQKKDRQMLDLLPMMNPQLKEVSSDFDKLLGRRVIEQDPEYIKIYLNNLAENKRKSEAKTKEEK